MYKTINIKGFTLIELLAVITILGVILGLAVPAVTQYITNSRKEGFISTAKLYTDAARKEATADVYRFPVNKNSVTIISLELIGLEKGGTKSSFGGEWVHNKSYVAILNVGTGASPSYEYFFAAQDSRRYGVPLTNIKQLEKSHVRRARDTMPVTIQELCGTKEGFSTILPVIEGLDNIVEDDNILDWNVLIYSGDKCGS